MESGKKNFAVWFEWSKDPEAPEPNPVLLEQLKIVGSIGFTIVEFSAVGDLDMYQKLSEFQQRLVAIGSVTFKVKKIFEVARQVPTPEEAELIAKQMKAMGRVALRMSASSVARGDLVPGFIRADIDKLGIKKGMSEAEIDEIFKTK